MKGLIIRSLFIMPYPAGICTGFCRARRAR